MKSIKLESLTSENRSKKTHNTNIHQNDNERPLDPFIVQNKLIFKKYKPIKQIGRGTFSTVYLASILDTNKYVAIKAEKKSQNSVELLKSEAFLLYSLRGFGIPEVLSYGKTKYHNILVMPLLGKSLLDMFILRPNPVNINDISYSSLQILDRIEWVHANNIVYRDIKPENFLFGKTDTNVLYLIDFGLCRKYKSTKTGKHISPKNLGKFTGTSRYASIYAMAGNEQSRRDDIESIGYMIIFFMKKKLPWQGIKGNSYKECYHKLYLMKKHMELEILCRGLPGEVLEYMKYAKSLKFEQEPDYKYLKNLFQTILERNKISVDKYILSWCGKYNSINPNINNTMNNNNLIDNKKNINNKPKTKSTHSNKLYKKDKENLETEKNFGNNPNININAIIKNVVINNDNKMIDKNELNSNASNNMKILINKNIQSYNNSGQNQSAGINLNLARINSEKNVYSDNFFIQGMNNNLKGYDQQNYKIEQLASFNPQLTERNNFNNTGKILNYSSYFNNMNNSNKINKITSISPISNNSTDKIKNNISININNNKNKYNKITNIKITDTSQDNINKYSKINNSNNNNKENIIYNTYNTYNTYNSYNNINNINTPINTQMHHNNILLNSIYKRDQTKIINYQNYNRNVKTNIQNNNLLNFIKSETYNQNKENKINNAFQKNKSFIHDKYSSIEINKKNDSITGYFHYKNNSNQKDLHSYNNINNIRKSNTSLNKNKIISITPVLNMDHSFDKNNNINNNKIQHYNSYIINNFKNNEYSFNNRNNISRGKNNFLKITKHCNNKSLQNINPIRINNNIENKSMNIINSTQITKNYNNNKVLQNNQKNNKTLENTSYYITNNRYGLSKFSNSNSAINKNRVELNQTQKQKNINNIINNENKNRKNNKLIFTKMENSHPNHALKIIKTSSGKNIKNPIKLKNEYNANKIIRINKYKIVRNRNAQNH